MFLTHLQLGQFRSYDELAMEFCQGINCLSGPNGVGKTNVLDAIHYLALTKGFRASRDLQAVKKGEAFFTISGELIRDKVSRKIQCNFVKGQGKKVIVAGKALKRMSEHIGRMPLVAALPADSILVNGPSLERRRFMDVLISQYSSEYLTHLIRFERMLAQRNALLRQFAEQRRFSKEELQIWDAQMAPHAVGIHEARRDFLKEFLPLFTDMFHRIVSKKEKPSLEYKSQVEQNDLLAWMNLFESYMQRDQHNHYSGAGPHKDDLIFKIDEQSVRHFGSQGQQKTFVLALRLAQYKLLEQHVKMPPILLLDDIFDKLDEFRLRAIAHILIREIDGQVFVTDTSEARLREIFKGKEERELKFFELDFEMD